MEPNRFPELSHKQVDKIKPFGNIEEIPEEEILIAEGTLGYDFFVLLEGTIQIQSASNKELIIVVHTKNQFTGDSDMLSNRAAQFQAVTTARCKVIRIKNEKLLELIATYADISDLLLSTFILRQNVVHQNFDGGLQLIGSEHSKSTYEIRDFLSKNYIWHSWLSIEDSEDVNIILEKFKISKQELPIVIDNHGIVHKRPDIKLVAQIAGVIIDFNNREYDVVIIGAGPGGLGASVYAASEGLKVLTVDGNSPGGQAGKSSKIENYLGFPTGISGENLAKRAYLQAQKFGCHISIPHFVKQLLKKANGFQLTFKDESSVWSKAVVIATGAKYRKLPIPNFEKFEGQGIYYSASTMNIKSCRGQEVGVIGGGNSAGQAALFLADVASRVHIIIRSDAIESKMSNYLIQRISSCNEITVHLKTEVTKLIGENYLEEIEITTKQQNVITLPVENLFTFIGAKPCTSWLPDSIRKDEKGFLLSGSKANEEGFSPQSLETNYSGVFVVGDVRSSSTKRVASAVGEGALVVSQLHQFLSQEHPS